MTDSSSTSREWQTKDPEGIQSYGADTASSLPLDKEKSGEVKIPVEDEKSKGVPSVLLGLRGRHPSMVESRDGLQLWARS